MVRVLFLSYSRCEPTQVKLAAKAAQGTDQGRQCFQLPTTGRSARVALLQAIRQALTTATRRRLVTAPRWCSCFSCGEPRGQQGLRMSSGLSGARGGGATKMAPRELCIYDSTSQSLRAQLSSLRNWCTFTPIGRGGDRQLEKYADHVLVGQ